MKEEGRERKEQNTAEHKRIKARGGGGGVGELRLGWRRKNKEWRKENYRKQRRLRKGQTSAGQ